MVLTWDDFPIPSQAVCLGCHGPGNQGIQCTVHTQGSLLIAQGVDILTVSKRLGHAKVSTTLDIYSHVLAKSDEKASDILDNLLYRKQA